MEKATPRQTFALFCATKIDVRPLALDKDTASRLIGESKAAIDILPELERIASELCVPFNATKAKNADNWQELYNRARESGLNAVNSARVVPMVVSYHANPMDDSSPVVESWHVADGPCGFAWVSVRPGNCAFANWLKKNGFGRPDSYAGGVCIWISEFNQSIQRKEAYADAFASVLRDAGIKAYAGSRLD